MLRQPGAHLLELGLVAPGQRPAQPDGGVLGEVGGGQLTGEAGGSEDDDVELTGVAFSGHDPILPHPAGAEPDRPTLRPRLMDTPAKAALGGGLISTLAIGGMVAAGVLATSAAVVVSDPTAPPARADGLVRFADCDSLRSWYVDHTIDEVGPWGWGGQAVPMMAPRTWPARRAAAATRARRSPTARPAPTPRRPTSTSPTSPRPTGGSSYACGTGGAW